MPPFQRPSTGSTPAVNRIETLMIRQLYILIGNDRTGKTTLQKKIIKRLTGENHDTKLHVNKLFDMDFVDGIGRKLTLFTANRSYQEKRADYGTIENYFNSHFRDASVAILSSHSSGARMQIQEMIARGHRRFYQVTGVFFSNAVNDEVRDISELPEWDERLFLENPVASAPDAIEANIEAIAVDFEHEIRRKLGVARVTG